MKMRNYELPIPSHFNPKNATRILQVPYQKVAEDAKAWTRKHNLKPAVMDALRVCLMPIDCQNTFCIPTGELYVNGAEEDTNRLCEFIYRNLGVISSINPTMDTHTAMQIFHSTFWVNDSGENPEPMTIFGLEDVEKGTWKVNPGVAFSLAKGNYVGLQKYALHYVKTLSDNGKYSLCIWPYHAIVGGVGHALTASVEEAVFFHNIARNAQTGFEIKGGNPLTENYSVLRPEVLEDPSGRPIAQKNVRFIEALLAYDVVIIAGQAKSHCVAWTIEDLLSEINSKDPALVEKVYLLEDCTSPVVVPGIIDFTDQANEAFKKFADAGMHIVKSTEPMEDWSGISCWYAHS
jgi:nicotinamidase-related amidase